MTTNPTNDPFIDEESPETEPEGVPETLESPALDDVTGGLISPIHPRPIRTPHPLPPILW